MAIEFARGCCDAGAEYVAGLDTGSAIEQEVYLPSLAKPSISARINKNIGIDNDETGYAPTHQKIYTCQGVYCSLGLLSEMVLRSIQRRDV